MLLERSSILSYPEPLQPTTQRVITGETILSAPTSLSDSNTVHNQAAMPQFLHRFLELHLTLQRSLWRLPASDQMGQHMVVFNPSILAAVTTSILLPAETNIAHQPCLIHLPSLIPQRPKKTSKHYWKE